MTLLPRRAMAYRLGSALAVVSLAAAALSYYRPDVLSGPAVSQGNLRGTALIVMYVGVPLLVLGMVWTARGSARALVLWVGATAYVLYQSVLLLFGTPFNALFPGYVAMLGLGIWSAIALVRQVDLATLADRVDGRLPARPVAVYLWVFVVLNALAWLATIVPAIRRDEPSSFLDGSGMTTNPVFVQDLAFWLPLAALSALWLWRRETWGYLLAGGVTTMLVLEGVGVATDQWYGARADPSTDFASTSMVAPMLALAAISCIPLFLLLRNLDRLVPARQ